MRAPRPGRHAFRTRSRRPWVAAGVLTAVGTMVLGTGVVNAAINSPAVPGEVHGCVADKGGAVRIINFDASCRNDERFITWNKSGRKGAQGPQGPQGPQGVQGIRPTARTARTASTARTPSRSSSGRRSTTRTSCSRARGKPSAMGEPLEMTCLWRLSPARGSSTRTFAEVSATTLAALSAKPAVTLSQRSSGASLTFSFPGQSALCWTSAARRALSAQSCESRPRGRSVTSSKSAHQGRSSSSRPGQRGRARTPLPGSSRMTME